MMIMVVPRKPMAFNTQILFKKMDDGTRKKSHDFGKSSASRLQQLHQIQFELMNGKGLTQAPAAAPWFGAPETPLNLPGDAPVGPGWNIVNDPPRPYLALVMSPCFTSPNH